MVGDHGGLDTDRLAPAHGENGLGYRSGAESIGAVTLSRKILGPATASLQLKLFHEAQGLYLGAGVP